MEFPQLYVVFYRPRHGNYQHWALFIDNDEEKLIFEVIGQQPDLTRNTVIGEPENSKSFIEKLYVGTLRKDDIEKVKEVASSQHVDNETVEWDCQDYVIEMLDTLEDDFILDENDEDYIRAREELRQKRGAII